MNGGIPLVLWADRRAPLALALALCAAAGCASSASAGAHPRGHRGSRPHAAPEAAPTGVPAASPGTVYDPAQRVHWLADANLAADPAVRSAFGVTGVNADGTMSYATALRWVAAMNAYDGGAGYLGHHDWQLPTNPPDDPTCAIASGHSGNAFGPGCTASALGQLFTSTLGGTYPESLPPSPVTVGPMRGLRQGLFWTAGTRAAQPTPWDSDSAFTFSFASGGRGRNTTRANFFYVLPVLRGAIGSPPSGSGLVPYTTGPAAGLALYDTVAGLTWPLDAVLAQTRRFGVEGTTTLHFQSGRDLTVPRITTAGMMRFETAREWLEALNNARHAGASQWVLPTVDELRGLHARLGLERAPESLLATDEIGGFRRFQRSFYWACQRDQSGDSRSACSGANPGQAPNGTGQMQWAFNFQTGFQGTDEEEKEFFVLPYYPAP